MEGKNTPDVDTICDVQRSMLAIARIACGSDETLTGRELATILWILTDHMGQAVQHFEHA